MVESPVFVPFTKESRLRKRLQVIDDTIGESTRSPGLRFIERCGGQTIIDLLGRSNPWAKDLRCPREKCLPCAGKDILAREEEERKIPEPGQPPCPRPSKEETTSIPKCTVEGVGYIVECWPCRVAGRAAKYIGESSRSPYQRGKEHLSEIEAGKRTHPLVIHFEEAHQGQKQETLMRVIKHARSALDRQTWESVAINRMEEATCLNLKTEWGRSRDPALINRPHPKKTPRTGTGETEVRDQGTGTKRSGHQDPQESDLVGPRRKRQRPDLSQEPEVATTSTTTAATESERVEPPDPELYTKMANERIQTVAQRKVQKLPRKKAEAKESYVRKNQQYLNLVQQGVLDKSVATAWRVANSARKVGLGIKGNLDTIEEGPEECEEDQGTQTQEATTTATPSRNTRQDAGTTTAATTPVLTKIQRWEARLVPSRPLRDQTQAATAVTAMQGTPQSATTSATTAAIPSPATEAATTTSTARGPQTVHLRVTRYLQPTIQGFLARKQAQETPSRGLQGSKGPARGLRPQEDPSEPPPRGGQGPSRGTQPPPGGRNGQDTADGDLGPHGIRGSRGRPPGRSLRGRPRGGSRGRRGNSKGP